MKKLVLMLLLVSVNSWSFEFEAGNCKSAAEGSGFKTKFKHQDGRFLLWLYEVGGKQEQEVLKDQTVHLVENIRDCELYIISRNPAEVLFQLKMDHKDFDKKPPYDSLDLRAGWNFLYGEKYVDKHFYRLFECRFSTVMLSPAYVRHCSKKYSRQKLEFEEVKEDYWSGKDDPATSTGGGVLTR